LGSAEGGIMNMLISRRLALGGLGLLGAGLARRVHAQAASTEFHVGYRKPVCSVPQRSKASSSGD